MNEGMNLIFSVARIENGWVIRIHGKEHTPRVVACSTWKEVISNIHWAAFYDWDGELKNPKGLT